MVLGLLVIGEMLPVLLLSSDGIRLVSIATSFRLVDYITYNYPSQSPCDVKKAVTIQTMALTA